MNETTISSLKIGVSSVLGLISAKLGILAPILYLLILVSTIDYLTGVISSAITGKLSSRIGLKGILKKLCYFIAVGIAVVLDYLILNCSKEFGITIYSSAYLGCLVGVWLILNEILSIIENLEKAGVPLPPFLRATLNCVINSVESFSKNNARK